MSTREEVQQDTDEQPLTSGDHDSEVPVGFRCSRHQNNCADSIVYEQQEHPIESSRDESKEQSEDGNGDLLEVLISLFVSPSKRVLMIA